jgi:hypothetical protein
VSDELNDTNVADQVELAVQSAQKLDGWKQQILDELGDKADGGRIIIAHQLPDGSPAVTEVSDGEA